MTGTYALIENGIVINTIVWDGEPPMDFGEGIESVRYEPENTFVTIGYHYANGVFSPAPLTEEEEEAALSQKRLNNIQQKTNLLNEGTQRIVVWQTKLLIGRKLTAAETAALNAWLDYLDAVDAINADTVDDIKWPEKPE